LGISLGISNSIVDVGGNGGRGGGGVALGGHGGSCAKPFRPDDLDSAVGFDLGRNDTDLAMRRTLFAVAVATPTGKRESANLGARVMR